MIDWDDDDGVHRREENARSGGLRHEVAAPARIEGDAGGAVDAAIHDVSSSGMYLQDPMLVATGFVTAQPVGSKVSVTFAPDHANAPNDTVRLSAEIARRHPKGIGVRFIDMTRAQKRALHLLAALAVQSRAFSDGPANSESPGAALDPRPIMSACRKIIEHRLPNMIWMLRTEVVSRLRLMGRDHADEEAAASTAEAEQIDGKGTAIGRTIERRVMQTFAELGGLEDTRELVFTRADLLRAKKQAAPREDLDLVKDKALEGSVAMRTTSQRMESVLSGASFDVNVRLANVLRRRIDNIDNPLIPAVMCRMLWQSITEQCESPRVHACLHATIIKHIMPLLSELYAELDRVLDERGVPRTYWTS